MEKSRVIVRPDEVVGTINPNIYGHFIEHLGRCIYPGIWVGPDSKIPNDGGFRKDILVALKNIHPPVIRWPGGCFADYYHWRDGIGENRPKRVNLQWGGEESNEFGTDEFLRFCSKVEATPYICVNVGSGSLSEACQWVEYCNRTGNSYYAKLRQANGHPEPYNVKYWGVGNELWGCGGFFEPTGYAQEYRRFASFMLRIDPSIQLVACGHVTKGRFMTGKREWNLRFMEEMKDYVFLMHNLSFHHYFHGYGGDTDFSDDDYLNLLCDIQKLEYEIKRAIEIVDFFAEERRDIGIVIDEWGTWYPQATVENGLYQQNTLRDAILAASCFNIFNNYSRKVAMTNIAQMVNVLQSLFLTKGAQMVLTPTYHVFDMYKDHMGNMALKVDVESPVLFEPPAPNALHPRMPLRRPKQLYSLNASASLKEGKQIFLTVVNSRLDAEIEAEIIITGKKTIEEGTVAVLTSNKITDYNDFATPNLVKRSQGKLEPRGKENFTYVAPAHSVNSLALKLK